MLSLAPDTGYSCLLSNAFVGASEADSVSNSLSWDPGWLVCPKPPHS